jgi:hypothetical protein
MRGVQVVSFFWVSRGEERNKICKGGEEKPSSPALACPGEEDGKQCHQNDIVHNSFFK